MADSYSRGEAIKRVRELQSFISNQKAEITEFDEKLVGRLLEKITIYPDYFEVMLKSGISVVINQ